MAQSFKFDFFTRTEKNWLSTSLNVRKFHHLWNLLNRSCIYASTLLAIIEGKQAKRKQKLIRLKKRRLKAKKLQCSVWDVDRDKIEIEKLLEELVEQVSINFEIFDLNKIEDEFDVNAPTGNSGFSTDFGYVFEDISISTNNCNSYTADSALEESGIYSENQSPKMSYKNQLLVKDSYAVTDDSAYHCDDAIETFSGHEVVPKELCSDVAYVKSLQQRRDFCSSLPLDSKDKKITSLPSRVFMNAKFQEIQTEVLVDTLSVPHSNNTPIFSMDESKLKTNTSFESQIEPKLEVSISNCDLPKISYETPNQENFTSSSKNDTENESEVKSYSQNKTIKEESFTALKVFEDDYPALSKPYLLVPMIKSNCKVSQSAEDCYVKLKSTVDYNSKNNIIKQNNRSTSLESHKTAIIEKSVVEEEGIERSMSDLSFLPCSLVNCKVSRSYTVEVSTSLNNLEVKNEWLVREDVELHQNKDNSKEDCGDCSVQYFDSFDDYRVGEHILNNDGSDKKLLVEKHDNVAHLKNVIDNVSCPVCNKVVFVKWINKHLDICVGVETKINSLRNRSVDVHAQKRAATKESRSASKLTEDIISDARYNKNHMQSGSSRSVDFSCENNEEEIDSDNQDEVDLLPTGVEKLKAALNNAIISSNVVKSIVEQTASVEQFKSEKNVEKATNVEIFPKSRVQAFVDASAHQPLDQNVELPVKKSMKVKIRGKRRKLDESDFSDTEEEESGNLEEFIVSAVPKRRSSRLTHSVNSYREISSNEDEDHEFELKKKHPRKKKKQVENAEQNVSQLKTFCETLTSEKKSNSTDGVQEKIRHITELEDREIPMTDAEIKVLLQKKYYKPDDINIEHITTDENGFRYCHGMIIDPAQPKFLIGGVLREYQVTGYQWLKLLYENGESGILADEMGLGKTIQCISLMCKLFKAGVKGPFLVCGPTSTINNWMSEFKKFSPKISLLLFHGSAVERDYLWNFFLDEISTGQQIVLITSYETLLRDRAILSSYSWSYLVLDEGHRVKNLKSKTFAQLKSFPATCKLMLTGTPLQNNIAELWTLLNFIFPEVFDDVQVFETWFAIDSLQKNQKLLSMLHQILTPFVLRRVKSDVEVKIPPKKELLVSAPLGALQDEYYRATVNKSIRHLCENKEYYNVTPGVADPDQICCVPLENCQEGIYLRSKKQVHTTEKKLVSNETESVINITLNNMMMQLRKCCNHPYLIQYPLHPGTNELRIDEEVVSTCGKMMLLDRMLPLLRENEHKVLIFSQMTSMLDILEDYCNLREFNYLRFDGSTRCEERCSYINEFNENAEIFLFLLSTKAGGLGINLTAADTVIIYDSDWNPHNDIQAQDRCHRIGQEKPVVTYRLVTMGTIDQQIVERASLKRKLEKMVMHQEKFKGDLASELSNSEMIATGELLKLLEATTNISVVNNKESVISDAELRRLLDRSDMSRD